MQKGDLLACRCPKCRSTDLSVIEEFLMTYVYHVRGGVLNDRTSGDSPPGYWPGIRSVQ